MEFYPEDLTDEGLEEEPHITILYGLSPSIDTTTGVSEILKNTPPVEFSVVGISMFDHPDYDVIKLTIDDHTGKLAELNSHFKENFPYDNDFPVYTPHITLAYCKKGAGHKYLAEFEEATAYESNKFFYSGPNRETIRITGKMTDRMPMFESESDKLEVRGTWLAYIRTLMAQNPNMWKYQNKILSSVLGGEIGINKTAWYKIARRQLNQLKQVTGGKLKDGSLRYSKLN